MQDRTMLDPSMRTRIKACAAGMVTLLVIGTIGLYGATLDSAEDEPEPPAVDAVALRATMPDTASIPLQSDPAYTRPAWTPVRCRIYHYCECDQCTGKHEGHPAYGITATGTRVKEGRTVAVDPDVIPLGSEVRINGHSYTAEDTGVKGEAVDIYVPNHDQAVQMGTYETIVMWR